MYKCAWCVVVITLVGSAWLLGANRVYLYLPFSNALILTALLLGSARLLKQRTGWINDSYALFSVTVAVLFCLAIYVSPVVQSSVDGYRIGENLARRDSYLGDMFFLRTVSILALFYIVSVSFRTPSSIRVLIFTLAACAVGETFYSIYLISGGERLLISPEHTSGYSSMGIASGNFPNRNHFAGHLNMVGFLVIGLLISKTSSEGVSFSFRMQMQAVSRFFLSNSGRLRLALVMLVIGLVLTRSRTGNMAFISVLSLCFILMYVGFPSQRKAIAILLFSIAAVDVAVVSNFVGLDKVVDRIENTHVDREYRDEYNRDSLQLIASSPLVGTGPGSYASTIRAFQNSDTPVLFLHAHNDVLQFPAELGVPASLVLGLIVLASICAGFASFLFRKHPFYRGVGLGSSAAVCSICFHSLTDFNLQIPANAWLFVVCLAICWRSWLNDRA